jgi:hypothetical protein
MATLSKDEIQAYRGPEPFSETYFVAGLGGEIEIAGIVRKNERKEIGNDITLHREMVEKGAWRHAGLKEAPLDRDLVNAAYAAHCVRSPKLTAFEWLQFSDEGSEILEEIAIRCMVCSRIIDLDEKGEPGEEVPGIEAAKEDLLTDPSMSAGAHSA